MKGGGTSVSEGGSSMWLLVVLVVAPIAVFAIHYVGSGGGDLGWDYGSLGGAGRSIIVLSVLGGAVAGWLAGRAVRARETPSRARVLGIAALGTVALASLGARQFADYGAHSRRAGDREMSPAMCTWVREKLPACIDLTMGTKEGDFVRRSQPDCWADARSIATYERCMPVENCFDMVDCITKPPETDVESEP